MKRFYKEVTHKPDPNGGFQILLDGKPMRTPAHGTMICPNEAVADLVIKEWAGQGEKIMPQTMPLTQILSTKIDHVRINKLVLYPEMMKFLNTDLVCYRADQPDDLVKRQSDLWDPPLKVFEEKFGASLKTTTGLDALAQDKTLHQNLEQYLQALDDDRLTIFQMILPVTGSLVLTSVFVMGQMTSADLLKAIFAEEDLKDEMYNADIHGPDPSIEKKKKQIEIDLIGAEKYLKALDPEPSVH